MWKHFKIWPGTVLNTPEGKGVVCGLSKENQLWIDIEGEVGPTCWGGLTPENFNAFGFSIVSRAFINPIYYVQQHLQKMLQNQEGDLPLIMNEKEEFFHTFYLKACLPLFDQVLGGNFKEAVLNEFELQWPGDEKYIKPILEFLYTGQIELDQHNVLDIYQIADYLLIDELKNLCLKFIDESSAKMLASFPLKFASSSACYNKFKVFPNLFEKTKQGEAFILGMEEYSGFLLIKMEHDDTIHVIETAKQLAELEFTFKAYESPIRMKIQSAYPVQKMGQLYDQKLNCDIQFTVKGKIFSGHAAYLKSCSPYFAKLISAQTDLTNPIAIADDYSAEEFEQFLTFLYKGELSSDILDKNKLIKLNLNQEMQISLEAVIKN